MSRYPIRVLVGIEQDLLRRGIREILEEEELEVVADAGEARSTLRAMAEHRPEVAVVDVAFQRHLPTFLAEARNEAPGTSVLVIVDHDEEECLLRLAEGSADWILTGEAMERVQECCLTSLRDRARGCCPRSASPQRLVAAVRTVAEGGISADEWALGRLLGRSRSGGEGEASTVTARELDVIQLVAEGHSNKRIAAELGLHHQTVKNTLSRIMEKLGVANRVEVALVARERNLHR